MGVNWDDTSDRQLLLTIIHLTAPQPPKWDQVAKTMGEGYTAEATRQHYAKLRKDCQAKLGEPEGSIGEAKKSTPRKPKASKASGETPKSTGKRKGREEANGDDDDASNGSPSKKQAVKKEENEDELV